VPPAGGTVIDTVKLLATCTGESAADALEMMRDTIFKGKAHFEFLNDPQERRTDETPGPPISVEAADKAASGLRTVVWMPTAIQPAGRRGHVAHLWLDDHMAVRGWREDAFPRACRVCHVDGVVPDDFGPLCGRQLVRVYGTEQQLESVRLTIVMQCFPPKE